MNIPQVSDLATLDDFLSSDISPESCMQLSDLDGFLTGIAAGPELIPHSEWLQQVWGADAPKFASMKQAQTILATIMSRYNDIVHCLTNNESIEPIFWEDIHDQIIADDWAMGFLDAVKLRLEAWQTLFRDPGACVQMGPILILAGDPEGVEGQDDAHIDRAIGMVPDSVAQIWAYWRRRDQSNGNTQASPAQPHEA